MMNDPKTPSELTDLLARERRRIEELHTQGAMGVQVSSALSELHDRVIQSAYRMSLETLAPDERRLAERELALVAVGDYGRGDLGPHSEVDLLFLSSRSEAPLVSTLVSTLVQMLWNSGLKVSQSRRTPRENRQLSREDFSIRTAVAESRQLAGSASLMLELEGQTRKLLRRTSINRFIDQVLEERLNEHRDFVASPYLLEPNVRKSPGGLRDLHALRWIALPRYGTSDLSVLRMSGILSPHDAELLSGAWDFLHRVRNELHFHAGAAQDVLTRDEQVRVARWLGFRDEGRRRGVETFMQSYFRQTEAVHEIVTRFARGARRRNVFLKTFHRLRGKTLPGGFYLWSDSVGLVPGAERSAPDPLDLSLELFERSRQAGVEIEPGTLERICGVVFEASVTRKSTVRFLSLLENPEGLGPMVRRLHRIGLLGRFIPALEEARGLIPIDRPYRYTLDEHSLRALEAGSSRRLDPGPLGEAYRQCSSKKLLHLAILLHAFGKGEGGGGEMADRLLEEMAARFGLSEPDRARLAFLVNHHDLMMHVALRRDPSESRASFVRAVGSLDALRMLYVLTAAEIEATAPGEYTSWKDAQLFKLYQSALAELAGGSRPEDPVRRAQEIRQTLEADLVREFPPDWLRAQLAATPSSYLLGYRSETIADHLRILRTIEPSGTKVEAKYVPSSGLSEFTAFTRDDVTPGLFAKITGVLAAKRFQIVEAEITTRADGRVIDTFRGVDTHYEGEPPAHRLGEISRQIEQVLLGRLTVEELLSSSVAATSPPASALDAEGAKVEFDTTSSEQFTILEVFALDRLGLLYLIARTLLELGLSIQSAKIATRMRRVVDVFYVTEQSGKKVADERRLEGIRQRLLQVLNTGDRDGVRASSTPAS